MTSGLFVLSVLAFAGAWKNPILCRLSFSVLCTCLIAFYAFYGIKVLIITSDITHSLELEECRMLKQYQVQAAYDNSVDDSKSATYTIQDQWIETLNNIYLMGRNSYCVKSPDGCPCK